MLSLYCVYMELTAMIGFYSNCNNIMLHNESHMPRLNSSPPGQNVRRFTDDIFRCIFVNENICILIKISLKFVPKGPIDNNPALV